MGEYDRVHPHFLSLLAEPRVRTFIHLKEFPRAAAPTGRGSTDLLEALGFKTPEIEKAGITPLRVFPELGLLSAWVKPKEFLDLLKEALARLVTFAEPVPRVRALLRDTVPLIGGDRVWSEGYTGKGVRVAVVDTGVWGDHPELRGRVIASRSFVEGEGAEDLNGHGTHVAGIIASNGEEYRGVAPGAFVVNAKVLDREGSGFFDDVIAGIMWAVGTCGADIVNMSFGFSGVPVGPPVEAALKFSSWMLDQMRRGVIFVAAAGNAGRRGYETLDYPAISPGVIAAAASDKRMRIADYSSRGSERIERLIGELKPSVTAPGGLSPAADLREKVISTFPAYIDCDCKVDDLHAGLSGTSMAAPHVSGGLALLLEALSERGAGRSDRYSLAVGALLRTARKLDADRYEQGWGFLNLPGALRNLGKFRYEVPPPESVEGLRRYWRERVDEAVEAFASATAGVMQALLGLGILGMAVSELVGSRGDSATRVLAILRDMYERGQISREQFILAARRLLDANSI
jgi:subtilisin family serine protease